LGAAAVANLHFTQNLARHTDCPSATLPAETVAELLEGYFARWPAVRGYVLDDQGEVRHHVKVLVDGRNVKDRRKLTDRINQTSEVYVFQALSGG
jgi:sulfur-carrier protein